MCVKKVTKIIKNNESVTFYYKEKWCSVTHQSPPFSIQNSLNLFTERPLFIIWYILLVICSKIEVSKILSVPRQDISFWRDVVEIKKTIKSPAAGNVADSTIVETKGLTKEQREELIEQAASEDFGKMEMRRRVSEIKAGERPEPIQLERTANNVIDDYQIRKKLIFKGSSTNSY